MELAGQQVFRAVGPGRFEMRSPEHQSQRFNLKREVEEHHLNHHLALSGQLKGGGNMFRHLDTSRGGNRSRLSPSYASSCQSGVPEEQRNHHEHCAEGTDR